MDRIELDNKDLNLSLLVPGTVYKRSRFDWTGIVDQITLSGVPFLGTESDGAYRGTEGIGLSSEFDIVSPPGYGKTLPGQSFMKIGIGCLRRESSEDYDFMKDYQLTPFETEIKTGPDKVTFSQLGCTNRSFSYDLIKEIIAGDREVIIRFHLINRGRATIKSEEYCHNFFRPGNRDISGSMSFSCSHPFSVAEQIGDLDFTEPKRVSFRKKPESVFYMSGNVLKKTENFSWAIEDREKNISVKGFEDFPVSRIALWGMSHVISPETFNEIVLESGEDLKWSRRYLFEI
ncbi:MAG: hypothetical protein JXR86_12455 [Spirochaetales bacterium]|nr:hypothetical protein [Spirochaetales bacterium]